MFYGKRLDSNNNLSLFKLSDKPTFKVEEINEDEYNKLFETLCYSNSSQNIEDSIEENTNEINNDNIAQEDESSEENLNYILP